MSELGDRIDALVALFQSVAPARVITRDLQDFAVRDDFDLLAGVFTFVTTGVTGYQNTPGLAAALGTAGLIIIGQIRVVEDAAGEVLEEAEFLMMDDVKALANADLPSNLGGFVVNSHTQSQQIEKPYGWIAVQCELLL